jgi:hypothetical protein
MAVVAVAVKAVLALVVMVKMADLAVVLVIPIQHKQMAEQELVVKAIMVDQQLLWMAQDQAVVVLEQ